MALNSWVVEVMSRGVTPHGIGGVIQDITLIGAVAQQARVSAAPINDRAVDFPVVQQTRQVTR